MVAGKLGWLFLGYSYVVVRGFWCLPWCSYISPFYLFSAFHNAQCFKADVIIIMLMFIRAGRNDSELILRL